MTKYTNKLMNNMLKGCINSARGVSILTQEQSKQMELYLDRNYVKKYSGGVVPYYTLRSGDMVSLCETVRNDNYCTAICTMH